MSVMNASKTLAKLALLTDRFAEIIETKKKVLRISNQTREEDKNPSELVAPNQKRYRTYNQYELEKVLFDEERSSYALVKIIEELDLEGIYKTEKGGNVWAFSQNAVNKMLKHVGKRISFKREGKMQVIIISNLKGGVGKSCLSINLSAGLATVAYSGYRVLVIDLDPQATLTNTYAPFLERGSFMTVGDLLCGNFELDNGETFGDAVRSSCLKTNIPDLDILPADTTDVIFDSFVRDKQFDAIESGVPYSAHTAFEPIMDALKDHYDIVIIDTPPRISEAVTAAHYSATSVIIPMRPSQGDHDSSSKYLLTLNSLYQRFIKFGHKGYDNIKLIQVGTMGTSESDLKTSRKVKARLGGACLPDFKSSEAVKRCSDILRGIFELSPSEYAKRKPKKGKEEKTTQQGSRVSLMTAQSNMTDITLEVEAMLQEAWDHEDENKE